MGSEYAGRHPGVKDVMKYLTPNPNLSGVQAEIAEGIFSTAGFILENVEEDSDQLITGLNKLLEAKDYFVRASLNL